MRKIKVLFFDLDDTLVDSEAAYEVAMKEAGLPQDLPEYLEARAQVKAQLPHLHPNARNRLIYCKRVLENKKEFSAKRNLHFIETYERAIGKHISEQWTKLHRNNLFTNLKTQGYRMILVTNETVRMQLTKLSQMDPEGKYFEALVCSEEVGSEKPQPEIFKRALQLAAVSASECCMIGDNFVNDVQGAQALGIHVIKTTEFLNDKKTQPHLKIIEKLDHLPQALEDLTS